MQMDLDMWHGRPVQYYAGYTFGFPKCAASILPWVSGVIVTPRWLGRLSADLQRSGYDTAVMLDNGAWPAFVRGESLSYAEVINDLKGALAQVAPEFIVLPDSCLLVGS